MKRFFYLLVALLISQNFFSAYSVYAQCNVSVIPTTSTNNARPQIDGNKVVWRGAIGGVLHIFKYDGTTVNQISTTSTFNENPQISGNTVVWEGSIGGVSHIFKHDGTTLTQLSTTSTSNASAQISGNTVVWVGTMGGVSHIFKHDGTTLTQLSTTSTNNISQQISGNTVVWSGYDGTTFHIYKHDGTSVTLLSTTSTLNDNPQISGNTVVWQGTLGGVSHIFKHDGTTLTQLSTTSTNNVRPQISGNSVVWEGTLGGVSHIFKHDGTTLTQLSTTSTQNFVPQISGNSVVWQGTLGGVSHIFRHDGTTVSQLSTTSTNNNRVQISGNIIVWYGLEAGLLNIYRTSVATATETMTWTGGVSTNWSEPCNWSPNGVPTATNAVIIPATTNDPIISSGTSFAKTVQVTGSGASLTVNAGATLTLSADANDVFYINNAGHLTNRGTLNVTNTYPTSNSRTAMALGSTNTPTADNYGTINLTSSQNLGLELGTNATFQNYSGGNININASGGMRGDGAITNNASATITIVGSNFGFQFGGTLTNSGLIDVTGQIESGQPTSQIINNACGIIKLTGAYFNGSQTTTNNGFMSIGGTLHNTSTGTFANNGVLKYLALNVSSSFTNNKMLITNTCPIFTLGGTNNYTVNGIFTNEGATTSAGTYNAGSNKFTANNTIPTGTQTLYTQVTDGTCTFVVPFDFNNVKPTAVSVSNTSVCAGASVTLSATCASGTPTWYTAATGGTSIGTGASLSHSPTVATTYYVACESTNCTSGRVATNSVTVNATTTPSVSISPTAICEGTSTTLNATATNGGSSPQFYWTKNNEPQGISDFINKTTTAGLGSNTVFGVYVDNAGTIYAATYGGGLSISSNGGTSFSNKTTANGLGANFVNAVYVNNAGKIYAATDDGLSISSNGGTSFINKTTANGLGNNIVNGVYVDNAGTIYAATVGGLSISSNGGTSFSNKTTANGLGNNILIGVYVDNAGKIYAATQGGLSISTDGGTSFINKTTTANGLGGNFVYGVYVDNAGTIYAATPGGLSISTDGGATFSNKSFGSIVRAVSVGTDGTIYAATQGTGLHISTDGGTSFINKTTATGLAGNYVYGLHVGNDGTIYAATSDGLSIAHQATGNSLAVTSAVAGDVYKVRLVPSAEMCPSPATALASVTINATPSAPTGTSNSTICNNATASLSATCTTGTVKWYDSNSTTLLFTGSPYLTPNLTANTTYNVRCEDGTCNSAFVAVAVTMSASTTPTVSIIPTAICAGTSTTLTATATNGGSSPQFYWTKNNDPQGISAFINKTTTHGLGSNGVYGVYVDNAGKIYAATFGGLGISTNGGTSFTNKTTADGLGANRVNGVYVDNVGTIYAATLGGLSISTNGGTSFTNKTTVNGLGDNLVYGVYVDNAGTIYAATRGGLSISTDGGTSFTNKTTVHGLGNNIVGGVYVDNAGTIYAATLGGLSISTDGGTSFTNKTTATSLGSNRVYGVYVDNAGTIYAATDGGGLSISTDSGTSFTNKTTANGLGSNTVNGVYVDNAGTIYAATFVGLSISTDGGTSFSNKTTANGLGYNIVINVYVDNAGTIYAATNGGGLSIASQATGNSLAVTSAVAGDVYKVRLVPSAEVCPSPATALASVTITTPSAPTGTSNPTICNNTTASLSASCTTGNPVWYDASSVAIPFTGSPFVTPNLTTTTTYNVRCESGSCTSAFVAVNVSINAVSTPTGTNSPTICNNTNASLSATCATGSPVWYDASSVAIPFTGSPFVTPNLTANTTYNVRCESGTCNSAFVPVTVSINPTATATETMTWTGTVSTDWSNACNWSPNGVPTATNAVLIPDVANDPIVPTSLAAVAKNITFPAGNPNLTVQNNATLTVTGTVVNLKSATITNAGTISTAGFRSENNTGPFVETLTFLNQSTGVVNGSFFSNAGPGGGLSAVNLTNHGSINYSGSGYVIKFEHTISILNNYGTINITGGLGIYIAYGTNYACGKILLSVGEFAARTAGSSFTNNGLVQVTGTFQKVSGVFTNNGVLKYGTLTGSGTLTSNQNSSIIVNNTPTPIFTYGGTYDGTINGIFTNAAATTSAGTFTAPNTFVPSGLPAGSQTLYAKITPSGGACSYVVPFTYNNVAKKLFVKADAAGANNGASWTDALTNLQSALAIAITGDEIWVAKGTYKPTADASGNTTPTDPRTKTFVMKDGVKIYGSFAGTEANLSERTLAVMAANPAILSGDFNGDDVVSGSGSTLSITGNAENSIHVIDNNYTSGNPLTAAAVLDGFVITGGNANATTGGGMSNSNASPSLSNLTFIGNNALGGGGLYNFNSNPVLKSITFSNNMANIGGGMNNYTSIPSLINVSFSGNNATTQGGGMINVYFGSSLSNVSFFNNNATNDGGAIFNALNASPNISNSIFWGNTKNGNANAIGADIFNESGTTTVKNTLLQLPNTASNYPTTGGGKFIFPDASNIFAQNPLFVNATDSDGADNIFRTADDGLMLSVCSPAINAGNNADIPSGITTDIVGNPRTFNTTVDMGAYELQANQNIPTLTVGTIPAICTGATSFTIPYTATTGSPTTYSISGTGITTVTDGTLPSGSITVSLSAAASGSSIPFTLTVKNASGCISASITGSVTVSANTLYVDASNIIGRQDGTSWATAYTKLQDAIDAATTFGCGVEIYVAAGTYLPTKDMTGNASPSDNRTKTFYIKKDGMKIYGGYPAGGGTRNVATNLTILSGDFNANDVVSGSGSTLSFSNNTENAYHVVYIDGTTSNGNITAATLLDGFRISGGNANGINSPNNVGGGVFNNGQGTGKVCSPTFANCTLSSNSAIGGGGMFNSGFSGGTSSPSLTNCTLNGNKASNYGGGMYNSGSGGTSSPSLTNCTLSGNKANDGGGMYNFGFSGGISSPSLSNCTLSGNSANLGGGMYNKNSNPNLSNSMLSGNSASYGGGMYNSGSVGTSRPSLTNCILSGNSASNHGGGMFNYAFNGTSSPSLSNCTLSGNSASQGGGMYNYSVDGISSPSLSNCTLSGNSASQGGGMYNYSVDGISGPSLSNCILWTNGSEPIHNSSATTTISYSIYDDGTPNGTLTLPTGVTGNNNLDSNPLFTDAANGNYTLISCSPAINAGNNEAIPSGITTDLAGNSRIFNTTVDMGAYELQANPATRPTLTVGSIPAICSGATSFTIPYTATTGTPTTYTISGTGITTVTDGTLPSGSITVSLSAAASGTSIPFTLTVKNASGCTSAEITGSVTVNANTTPSLSINPTALCAGTSTTLTATATNGGSSPLFYWTKNNTPQGTLTFSNKSTADGLGSNQAQSVYVDKNGTVYAAMSNFGGLGISTDGGASFITKTPANSGLGSTDIRKVFVDKNGTLYVATEGGGLSISTDGGTSFMNRTVANSGLADNGTYSVFVDKNGTIYVGTGAGLSISTNGGASFITKTTANGLGDNYIFDIYVDDAGKIYAANRGLSISSNGGTSFTNRNAFNSGLLSDNLNSVFVDNAGTIYLGTHGGLSISTDGGTSFINKTPTNSGLGSTRVSDVFVDNAGIIYAATHALGGHLGGLSISTDGGASFINKTTADGLGNNRLFSVFVDKVGKIYIGMNGNPTVGDFGVSIGSSLATGNTMAVSNAVAGDVYKVRLVPSADACPSPATATASVTVNALPTATANSNSPICSGTTLNLTGGGTGTYSWSGPNSFTSTVQNPTFLNVATTDAGTYTVTVTGAGACTSTATVMVMINATPTAPTGTSNPSICNNTKASLSATCTTGTVKWYGSDSATLLHTGSPFATPDLTANTSYQVRCEGSSCNSAFVTVAVTVNPVVNPPTVTPPSQLSVCSTTLTLTATCTSGTVLWSNNATGTSLTLSAVGNYAISAKCTANGCDSDASSTTNLEIKAKPTTPTVMPPSQLVVCSPNTLTLTATCASGTVLWSDNSTGTSLTLSAVGTYAISAKCTTNGCDSDASSTTNLEIKAKPTVPTITPPSQLVVCTPNTLTLTATCASGTVLWSDNSTGTSLTLSEVGTYAISAKCTANGCDSDASSITNLEIKAKPTAPTVTPPSQLVVCSPNTLTLTATCASGTVLWFDNSTGTSLTLSAVGTYAISAKCTTNGCDSDASSTTNLEIKAKPTAPTVTPPSQLVVCSPNTLTLTATCASGTVLWSDNATGTSLTLSAVGTYAISAKCTANGCDSDASSTTNLEIKAKPTVPTVTPPSQLVVCSPNTLTLTATCTSGTVLWSDNSTGTSLTLSAVGTYAISAKCTTNGCDSDASSTTNLEIKAKPTAPTVTPLSQLVVCSPNTLTLTATCASGTVLWSDNSTGTSLTLSAVGTYAISAKCTTNGCDSDASSTTNLEIKAKPTVPTITPPSQLVVCSPNTLTLTATCASGTVLWSDNSTGSSLTLSAVGTYAISAKCTTNGCDSDASSTTNLEIKALPNAQASNNGPYQIGNTISLSATGGETYSWSGPNNFTSNIANPMITNALQVNNGIYTVTVMSGICSATATTNVIVSGIDPCIQIMQYSYVQAGNPYEALFDLTNGMTIAQNTNPTSIVVRPICPSVAIESVDMTLSGPVNYTILQNVELFALFDNSANNVYGQVLPAGTYTLTIIGYAQDNRNGGIVYGPVVTTFTIVGSTPTISMPTFSGTSFCSGSSLNVNFSTTGTFSTSNQFQVLLSDANGNFNNSQVIGTSTNAGNVLCTIPNQLLGGVNYRLKVISTDPAASGNSNPAFLIIHPKDLNFVSPTDDINTNIGTKQASQAITATNKVNSTANVIYQAGKYITLNTGFEAKAGTVFQAQIGGCGNN